MLCTTQASPGLVAVISMEPARSILGKLAFLKHILSYLPLKVPKRELSKKVVGQFNGAGDVSNARAGCEEHSLEGEQGSADNEGGAVFLGDFNLRSSLKTLDCSLIFRARSFHFLTSSFKWSSFL